jgi:rhodanese-related sulfurtransferase
MKIFTTSIIAVAYIFLYSCNTNSTEKNPKNIKENITVAEAYKLLQDDAVLIDVREPEELGEESYDVKYVKNIPLGDLGLNLTEIPEDKHVILACQKGGRSQKAFDLLKTKGFTNISNMEGGMNAWKEAGLPTKTGYQH